MANVIELFRCHVMHTHSHLLSFASSTLSLFCFKYTFFNDFIFVYYSAESWRCMHYASHFISNVINNGECALILMMCTEEKKKRSHFKSKFSFLNKDIKKHTKRDTQKQFECLYTYNSRYVFCVQSNGCELRVHVCTPLICCSLVEKIKTKPHIWWWWWYMQRIDGKEWKGSHKSNWTTATTTMKTSSSQRTKSNRER